MVPTLLALAALALGLLLGLALLLGGLLGLALGRLAAALGAPLRLGRLGRCGSFFASTRGHLHRTREDRQDRREY